MPETASEGKTWRISSVMYMYDPAQMDEELAEATPANATLLHWARSSTTVPPQEWWDDKTDPFAPSDE